MAPDARIIAIQVFSRFNNQADCGNLPAPCARTYPSDQIAALDRVLNVFAQNQPIAAVTADFE
jgi:hypothetical protein